jgi:hypothetical protein
MNKFKNISASGLVKTGHGRIIGIVVNSHSSGTVKLWDSLTAANTVLFNTMTLAVGERYINLFDVAFDTGLYVTIGGTADITVIYQ